MFLCSVCSHETKVSDWSGTHPGTAETGQIVVARIEDGKQDEYAFISP